MDPATAPWFQSTPLVGRVGEIGPFVAARHAMTAPEDLFVSEQHPVSRRWAVVEDDGRSAWLYLSEPGAPKPVAACWLYNRVATPAQIDSGAVARGESPIVPSTHAGESATLSPPAQQSVHLRWSHDGESVAVFFDADLIGFIARGHARGFSKHLRAPGPFGNPLDAELSRCGCNRGLSWAESLNFRR